MLSASPLIRPMASPVPPMDVMNIGRIGHIMSLLVSVMKLTMPSRMMLELMPLRSPLSIPSISLSIHNSHRNFLYLFYSTHLKIRTFPMDSVIEEKLI